MTDNRPSKIPRYVKTTPPIMSSEYCKVLRKVKVKRVEIEARKNHVAHLKQSLQNSTPPSGGLSPIRSKGDQRPCSSTSSETHAEYSSESALIGSQIRNVIIAPAGSKRKGIAGHFFTVYVSVYINT